MGLGPSGPHVIRALIFPFYHENPCKLACSRGARSRGFTRRATLCRTAGHPARRGVYLALTRIHAVQVIVGGGATDKRESFIRSQRHPFNATQFGIYCLGTRKVQIFMGCLKVDIGPNCYRYILDFFNTKGLILLSPTKQLG